MTVIAVLAVAVEAIVLCAMTAQIRRFAQQRRERPTPTAPQPGHRINLSVDRDSWDPKFERMAVGYSLVILTVPGCAACEAVKRELRDTAFPEDWTVYAVVDPYVRELDDREAFLSEWKDCDVAGFAPAALSALRSFDNPDEFPTVVLLRDGLVVASGFHVRDLDVSSLQA